MKRNYTAPMLSVFFFLAFCLTANSIPVENSHNSEILTACQGAPSYPCGGINVGGSQPWWEWIASVQVDAINNSSNKEGYKFFENEGPAVLTEGSQVSVDLVPGLSWAGHQTDLHWRVYIDYNRDGDFDDAGETVIEHHGMQANVSESITIPAGIDPGCSRMRITMQRDAFAGPCESFDIGEVEDYLVTLVAAPTGGGGGGGGGTTSTLCADRNATSNQICNNNFSYSFFGDFIRGVSGDGDYFSFTNGNFKEYTDGTAKLTGTLVNNHRADVVLNVDIDFSGRTTTPPVGSPKNFLCNQSGSTADFYYYPVATGTLTGAELLAGGVIEVQRTGEAFQLGTGANRNEPTEFGASGWFDYSIVHQPTSSAYFLTNEVVDFNLRLSGSPTACSTPPVLCADRDATSNQSCNNSSVSYSFWGDFVRGITGDGPRFNFTNGNFQEFPNGTAKLTGTLVNTHRSDVVFEVDVNFSGRTTTAPAGSPKDFLCNQSGSTSDFYYYPVANGTLTGRHLLAGGVVSLHRAGESFQVGTGANRNEPNEFGASGWFDYTIVHQPSSYPYFLTNVVVDFNLRLSGSPTACTAPQTSITLANGTDVTVTPAPGATTAIANYTIPTGSTTCPQGGLNVVVSSGPASGSAFPVGSTTVVFTATDACGNTATSDLVVTVNPAPSTSITLADGVDVTVTAASGATTAIANYTIPGASTTCPQGGLNVAVTSGPASGSAFPVGSTTVVFTATDACGNTATSDLVVTVNPGGTGGGPNTCTGTTPNYPCGGVAVGGSQPWWEWIERVQFANIDNSSAKESYRFFSNEGPATVTPGGTADLHITPGLSWAQYVTDLYYTAYIDFNQDGDFDDPGEEVLRNNATSQGVNTTVSIPATATSGLTRLRVVMQRDAYAGPCESFDFGETEDYVVCIDGSNPPAPVLTLTPPANQTVQIPQGSTTVPVTFPAPTATTTCPTGGLVVTQTAGPTSGTILAAGTYTVTYEASDACGNVETTSFTITVNAPAPATLTLTPPASLTVQIPQGSTTVPVTFPAPTATTTCAAGGLVVTQTAGPTSGTALAAGTYTITYEATDSCGNVETASFTITVNAPTSTSISLTCPADVTTPQIAPYGADVFIPVPSASTTCAQGGLTFTYDPVLPANRTPHFPVGVSTVTITATDNCGNTATCSYTITVTPSGGGGGANCTGSTPTYPCNGVNVGGWEPWWEWIERVQFANIDNSSGKEAYAFFQNVGPAAVVPGGSANLDITPGLSWPQYVTDLYYTAYIDFNQDGDFDDAGEEVLRQNTTSLGVSTTVSIPTGAATGLTRLRVVMQRDAYAGPCESFSFGEMEDYVVCIDGGNPPTAVLTLTPPANQTVQISQGSTTVPVTFPAPTATTTCAAGGLVVTQTAGPNSGTALAAGTYTVSFEATDACGNVETTSFTITVNAPAPAILTLTPPANQTVQIPQGSSTVPVTFPAPTATTTCAAGGLVVTQTAGPNSGTALAAGTYTVSFEATDACGNVETTSFTITVNAPAPAILTLTPPANQTVQIPQGSSTVSVTFPAPTATTTCAAGGLSVIQTAGPTSGTALAAGTYTVTFEASDACGNLETASFTLTVDPPAVTVCANRDATDVVHCTTGHPFGFFGNIVGGVHGDGTYFTITNSTFIEYTDGTAVLSGTAVNSGRSDIAFDFHVDFSGRTTTAPAGSPKLSICTNYANTTDFYYYPVATGTLTGRHLLAGGVVNLSRFAESFQVGTGANYHEPNEFGGSGWFDYTIVSHPSSYPYFIAGNIVDFNVRLDGAANACVTPNGAPSGPNCNNDILFVLDWPWNSADDDIFAKLLNWGYDVVVKDQYEVTLADAAGKGLVIISSTVESHVIGNMFKDVNVPVLTWESWLYDDMKMTGNVVDHDFGGGWYLTELQSEQAHPINAGLTGLTTVYPSYADYRWGAPSSDATLVANDPAHPGNKLIFVYDQGDDMVGLQAPAKRIGWFFDDVSASHLTADGWTYFKQAIEWATACDGSTTALAAAPPVNLTARPTKDGVVLTWITTPVAGDSHFVLERETADNTWETITEVPMPALGAPATSIDHLDEYPEIGQNVYRVRVVSQLEARSSAPRLVEYLGADAVTSYPNPASEFLMVSLKGFAGHDVDLSLQDAMGRVYISRTIENATTESIELSTAQFNSGMYILTARAGGATKSMKIRIINE